MRSLTVSVLGLILAVGFVATQGFAEGKAKVARSFSGGSAGADKIELAASKKPGQKIDEEARAMAKLEIKENKTVVRRSFGGGSAGADKIEIRSK